MKLYWKREDASVVSSVEQQTEQAAALARISGQELLVDPRTNPAVRPFATQLRDSQHRKILQADDRRVLRKIRVEDRRAEHAEKALESLQQAREASSPAKSVRALYASRTRYMHVSLATSIVLAFGSARGLEHLTTKYDSIPSGSGYIAEVGLTGLATIVILAKSELAQHGGKIKRWQDVALWSLMVTPLVASMVANVHGGNVIGAVCAAGAAAFAFFSYIVADTFATSARDKAEMVTGADETDLRKIATGDDLYAVPTEAGTGDANLNQPTRFLVPGSWFVPQKVQVRAEVQEVRTPEVPEPKEPQVREPDTRTTNPEPRTERPAPANLEPQVSEPSNPAPANHEVHEPAAKRNPEPRTRPTARTANLSDRAQKKAQQIEEVVNLIRERGEKAVTLGVVRDELGFTKTTAYHRLIAARELVNQGTAVAS